MTPFFLSPYNDVGGSGNYPSLHLTISDILHLYTRQGTKKKHFHVIEKVKKKKKKLVKKNWKVKKKGENRMVKKRCKE